MWKRAGNTDLVIKLDVIFFSQITFAENELIIISDEIIFILLERIIAKNFITYSVLRFS